MPPLARPHWQRAYDAQMGLWRYYRTERGRQFLRSYLRHHVQEIDQPEYAETRALLRKIVESEWARLIDCDPIFVSDEMCEVVGAAKDSFKPEPLLETDLITPRGFMFFETPFEILSRFDEPTNIAAVSWVMEYAFAADLTQDQLERLNRARYNREGFDEIESLLNDWGGRPAGIALTLYADTSMGDQFKGIDAPELLPMHLTPWYFGMTFVGNEVTVKGEKSGAEWWWRIVQTTFRLMQQQISVRHHHPMHRAARHEAKRAGWDDREIVVVRLRREKSKQNGEPLGEANYSHRFIVGGHWRNQPYPSEGITRQIWISPYVKGPEELPLVVRPRRVFQWTR